MSNRVSLASFTLAMAAAASLCGGPASLADEPESLRSLGFAASAFDAAMTRFAPEATATPPGLVQSPAPSFDEKLASYAGALAEDALYRANVDLGAWDAGPEPEAVLDGDWEVIRTTRQIPYRAICQIDITWPATDTWGDPVITSGSAAFISPRVLLTSGNNVYRDSLGGWATSIQVYPGRKGATRPYGTQATSDYFVLTVWQGTEVPQNDMGWIALPDHTLYDRINYAFDYRVPTDDQLERWDLNSLSYPRPYVEGVNLYHDFETQNQLVAAQRFRHFHDMRPESSGGPLYFQRNPAQPRQIVGVLSDFPSTTATNWACRMTQDYSDACDYVISVRP